MTEYTYTKSIASDFSDVFHSTNLQNEILSQGFPKSLLRIDRIGDNVDIVFNEQLESNDELILHNTIVPTHMSTTQTIYNNVISIPLKRNEIKSTTYNRIGTYTYLGTGMCDKPISIKAIGHMDIDTTNYSIRVYDTTNHNIIAEGTFTNTDEAIIDLGQISNLPVEEALIEISARITASKKNKAYLENVNFYFGL